MTPRKQLFRHAPEEGVIGDCWRTAIACLLDKRPEDVPHLIEDCWNDSIRAREKTKAYLATLGLSYVESAYNAELGDVLTSVGACSPSTYYILGGNSRTGCAHVVICCDDGIVWDPSPKDAGIVGPTEDGYYWVTWLVPLFLARTPAAEVPA